MAQVQMLDAGIERQVKLGYWESRRHLLYYKSLFQFVSVVGYDARTIIDIGSASAEYIGWMDWIPGRFMLDRHITRTPEGVTAIETDFFKFEPNEKFDVAMCCQVLEHVQDPTAFCTKLKGLCRRLIISVPYRWKGGVPGHIQDPVDRDKLQGWMGVRPNSQQVVHEPFRARRLIAYYDLEEGPRARFDKKFVFEAIAERAKHMKV